MIVIKLKAYKGLNKEVIDFDETAGFCCRQGNYQGAINAYTRALELDGTQVNILANRAACHFKLGQNFSCQNDCSDALQMLGTTKVRVEDHQADEEEVKVHCTHNIRSTLSG